MVIHYWKITHTWTKQIKVHLLHVCSASNFIFWKIIIRHVTYQFWKWREWGGGEGGGGLLRNFTSNPKEKTHNIHVAKSLCKDNRMNHLGWLNYRLFMVFTSLMGSKGHAIVHAIESVNKYVSLDSPINCIWKILLTAVLNKNKAEAYVKFNLVWIHIINF